MVLWNYLSVMSLTFEFNNFFLTFCPFSRWLSSNNRTIFDISYPSLTWTPGRNCSCYAADAILFCRELDLNFSGTKQGPVREWRHALRGEINDFVTPIHMLSAMTSHVSMSQRQYALCLDCLDKFGLCSCSLD